jgi:hypothetical protein
VNAIAICSLLGESPHANSVTRRFRGEPVLRHTLRRVRRTEALGAIVVIHWDDQSADLALIDGVTLSNAGPRRPLATFDAITAALRWCDGWRGGLLGTAACDRGFDAATVGARMREHAADAVILVDPAAALVDPDGLSRLIAAAAGKRVFYFNHAPPGLGGALLKRAYVDHLAATKGHAGRQLHYAPDAPCARSGPERRLRVAAAARVAGGRLLSCSIPTGRSSDSKSPPPA